MVLPEMDCLRSLARQILSLPTGTNPGHDQSQLSKSKSPGFDTALVVIFVVYSGLIIFGKTLRGGERWWDIEGVIGSWNDQE